MSVNDHLPALRSRVPRARISHVVALCFLMNLVSQVDRSNLGLAFPYMQKDLGFDEAVSGLAGSIFFIGYFLLQMPSGKLAEKWSAKGIVIVAGAAWGLLAMVTAMVQNTQQLLVLRFVFGLAESAQVPALAILMARYFSSREMGRAMAFWVLSTPVSSVVGSVITGWLLNLTGSWRAMMALEGVLPFIGILLVAIFVKDRPEKAKWLSDREREYMNEGHAIDRSRSSGKPTTLKAALSNRVVIQLAVIYFLLQFGQYGFALWLPTIVRSLVGGNDLQVGLMTALPWTAAAIGLVWAGVHSDRTGERRLHIGILVMIGAAALLVSALVGPGNAVTAMIALIIALGFFQGYLGIFYALVPESVQPAAVGVTMGLVNGIGTLGGGFAGPLTVGWLNQATGSNLSGQIALVIVLVAGAVLTMLLPKYVRGVGRHHTAAADDLSTPFSAQGPGADQGAAAHPPAH